MTEDIVVRVLSMFDSGGIDEAVDTIRILENQLSRMGEVSRGIKKLNKAGMNLDDTTGNILDSFGNLVDIPTATKRMFKHEQSLIALRKAEQAEIKSGGDVLRNLQTTGNMLKRVEPEFKSIGTFMGDITKKSRSFGRFFDMNALSVMFFGMQIQRTFQTILTSTIDTYNKITQGSTLAAQAINALKVNWILLKFTIGEAIASALMPLIPAIINIITKISDWVSRHKELVGTIVMVGLAVGTLAFMYGMLKLGMTGAWNVITGLISFFSGQAVSSTMKFNDVLAFLGKNILKIAFWVIIAVVAWEALKVLFEKFPQLKEGMTKAFESISSSIGSVVDIVADLITDIAELVGSLFGAKSAAQFFDGVFTALAVGLKGTVAIVRFLVAGFEGLISLLYTLNALDKNAPMEQREESMKNAQKWSDRAQENARKAIEDEFGGAVQDWQAFLDRWDESGKKIEEVQKKVEETTPILEDMSNPFIAFINKAKTTEEDVTKPFSDLEDTTSKTVGIFDKLNTTMNNIATDGFSSIESSVPSVNEAIDNNAQSVSDAKDEWEGYNTQLERCIGNMENIDKLSGGKNSNLFRSLYRYNQA